MIKERGGTEKSHFGYLVDRGEALLKNHKYEQVVCDVLVEHNHGHSGWLKDIEESFNNPQTEDEKILAKRMSMVIEKTIGGLLQTTKPGKEFVDLCDIETIAVLLGRIGDTAPKEIVEETRDLLEKTKKMGGHISEPLLEKVRKLKGTEYATIETIIDDQGGGMSYCSSCKETIILKDLPDSMRCPNLECDKPLRCGVPWTSPGGQDMY